MVVIDLDSVSHTYGRQEVLRNIDLRLGTGVTGLLGPNGAGKTTLLQIVALHIRPKRGALRMDGVRISGEAQTRECRARIGYLPQRFEVMNLRTVRDNVEFAAWAHGVDRSDCASAAARAIERVGLADKADVRAFRLSGGMRQRLGLACSIVHDPRVLVFDEPTVGIDPVQRSHMRKLFREIAEDAAVLLSTHIVDDVTHVCDRVLVMDRGSLRFDGTVDELEQVGLEGGGSDESASAAEHGYVRIMEADES